MDESRNSAHPQPYVGAGESGARRSANIDRDQAEDLDYFDERRNQLMESARAWDAQADELMKQRIGQRPELGQVRAGVGNENCLAALELLKLSPAVEANAASYTIWSDSGEYVDDPTASTAANGDDQDAGVFQPDPSMDWDAWVTDVDENGRGWSTNERNLFELVAGLTVDERKVSLHQVFSLGSWERDALAIVVGWASGGNQRDLPGRYQLAPRLRSA